MKKKQRLIVAKIRNFARLRGMLIDFGHNNNLGELFCLSHPDKETFG